MATLLGAPCGTLERESSKGGAGSQAPDPGAQCCVCSPRLARGDCPGEGSPHLVEEDLGCNNPECSSVALCGPPAGRNPPAARGIVRRR